MRGSTGTVLRLLPLWRANTWRAPSRGPGSYLALRHPGSLGAMHPAYALFG